MRARKLSRRETTLRVAQLLVVLGSLAMALPVFAQGCSQCSQAVGQTPARTQAGYRKGIIVLVIAASGVFASAVVVLKRFR